MTRAPQTSGQQARICLDATVKGQRVCQLRQAGGPSICPARHRRLGSRHVRLNAHLTVLLFSPSAVPRPTRQSLIWAMHLVTSEPGWPAEATWHVTATA